MPSPFNLKYINIFSLWASIIDTPLNYPCYKERLKGVSNKIGMVFKYHMFVAENIKRTLNHLGEYPSEFSVIELSLAGLG